jgi:DNA-binding transcriptional LysR family regulator
LTRQGEVLARRAKLMQLEYRTALSEIAALDEGLAGALRVAAGPMWLMTLLPPAVTAFHAEFPNIHVRLTEGVIDTLVRDLLTGEVDIVCTTLSFPGHAEVVKEPLLGIRHVVYARSSHPLAARDDIRQQELLEYAWVALADDGVGTGRIGAFFVANNLAPPNIAVETCAMGMLNLMASGDFLGLMPAAAAGYLRRFGLEPIHHEGSFWDSQSGIAHLRSHRPTPIIDTFKAFLRSSIGPRNELPDRAFAGEIRAEA